MENNKEELLLQQLEKAAEELRRLQQELEEKKAALVAATEKIGRIEAERDDISVHLREARAEIETSGKKVAALEQDLEVANNNLVRVSKEVELDKETLAKLREENAALNERLEDLLTQKAAAEGTATFAEKKMDEAQAESKELGAKLGEANRKRKRNFRWALAGWAVAVIALAVTGVCAWLGVNYYYETGPFAPDETATAASPVALTGTIARVTYEGHTCRIETEDKVYTVPNFDRFYAVAEPRKGDKLAGVGLTKEGKYFVFLKQSPPAPVYVYLPTPTTVEEEPAPPKKTRITSRSPEKGGWRYISQEEMLKRRK